MAPVSQVRGSGDPDFVIGDLPVSIDQSLEITLEKPQIYIGEGLGGYAVVGASRDEVDFTDENQETQDVRYDEIGGQGGVEINSFIRKTAFALRFGQIEPLISNFLTDESRIIYVRDVRDRVEKLAPFLKFDSDPYPVILDGRMVYVVDGYTTTDRYPYSQRASVSDLDRESGLRDRFNYVRNSVKAVVDAFDGDVKFYIVDPDDPIIQAYQSAFSGFSPLFLKCRKHLLTISDTQKICSESNQNYGAPTMLMKLKTSSASFRMGDLSRSGEKRRRSGESRPSRQSRSSHWNTRCAHVPISNNR